MKNQPSGGRSNRVPGSEIQPDAAAGQRPSDSSLTDLFGLHGGRVLAAEAELCDGHVVQDDVEVFGPLKQLPADQHGNLQETESDRPQCQITNSDHQEL